MKIPLVDLKAQYNSIKQELDEGFYGTGYRIGINQAFNSFAERVEFYKRYRIFASDCKKEQLLVKIRKILFANRGTVNRK